MPRRKPFKPHRSQSRYWHRLYVLLNTTNYISSPDMRRMLAANEDDQSLAQSCISDRDPSEHNWTTRWVRLDKLHDLLLEQCSVGRHGTSLRDCVRAIRDAAWRHQVHAKAMCRLYKQDNVVGITMNQLHGREQQIADDVRHEPNMIAANGGTAEVGKDTLTFKWEIPSLRRTDE